MWIIVGISFDLSKGIVDPKLAEAEPDILPLSATFIVNTVSSIDIAFLYIYLYHVVTPDINWWFNYWSYMMTVPSIISKIIYHQVSPTKCLISSGSIMINLTCWVLTVPPIVSYKFDQEVDSIMNNLTCWRCLQLGRVSTTKTRFLLWPHHLDWVVGFYFHND